MSEEYPITTRELIAIAGKEIAKTIPFAGGIVSAGDAVFGSIEKNRIKLVLEEVFKRLDRLEKEKRMHPVIDEQVMLHGCEQARHDPLVHLKLPEYGGAIVHYMQHPKNLTGLVEVMENLRKLNVGDLRILLKFRVGVEVLDSRRVDELVGYSPQLDPFGGRGKLRDNMTEAFPSFKRLEGLGVLFLASTQSGGVVHEIGPLSQYMSQTAFLTDAGRRLIEAIPS